MGGIFVFSQVATFFSDIVEVNRSFLFIHNIAMIVLLIFILRNKKES